MLAFCSMQGAAASCATEYSPTMSNGSFTVAIVNLSSSVADADIQAALHDLQAQVGEDFAPLWGGPDAVLAFRAPNSGDWVLRVEDDSTVQGALGFHELANDVPTAHVFARTAQRSGVDWRITTSHELLEMLADPRTNMAVVVDTSTNGDGTQGRLYMAEACDAVEQSSYQKGSTPVSDFVTPAWFDPSAPAGSRFDFLNQLSAPLTLLPGGSYIGVLDFRSTRGWQQETAQTTPEAA